MKYLILLLLISSTSYAQMTCHSLYHRPSEEAINKFISELHDLKNYVYSKSYTESRISGIIFDEKLKELSHFLSKAEIREKLQKISDYKNKTKSNTKESEKQKLIDEQIKKDNSELLLFLGENNFSDLTSPNSTGAIPIYRAAELNKLNVVRTLLRSGVDVNSTTDKKFASRSALAVAASNGHLELIKFLILSGADINRLDVNGYTALNLALLSQKFEAIKILLESKADPNITGPKIIKPLIYAASRDYKEVVELLLQHGADPNLTYAGTNALISAASNGYIELVNRLIPITKDLNHRDGKNMTALFVAIQQNHGNVVEALVEAKVDLTLLTPTGVTAKDLAYENQRYDIVRILSKAGAK